MNLTKAIINDIQNKDISFFNQFTQDELTSLTFSKIYSDNFKKEHKEIEFQSNILKYYEYHIISKTISIKLNINTNE